MIYTIASGYTKDNIELNPYYDYGNKITVDYKLLGLTTILKNKGHKIKMFQGDYKNPLDVIETISPINKNDLIIISVNDVTQFEWATKFLEYIKQNKVIITGNMVQVNCIKFLQEKFNYMPKFYIIGDAEDYIQDLIKPSKWKHYKGKTFKCEKPLHNLDYKLLYNYEIYHPIIEIDRQGTVKSPSDVILEIKNLSYLYNKKDLKIIFKTELLSMQQDWIDDFCQLYGDNELSIQWRIKLNCNFDCKNVSKLSKAGLKIVDLNLRTASIHQLLNAKITKEPQHYLKEASLLLKELHRNNVLTNILLKLEIGEDDTTLLSTQHWLSCHKEMIKGIEVKPTIFTVNDLDLKNKLYPIEIMYGDTLDLKRLNQTGYLLVPLSDSLRWQIIIHKHISEITTLFMTEQDYKDLLEFGYSYVNTQSRLVNIKNHLVEDILLSNSYAELENILSNYLQSIRNKHSLVDIIVDEKYDSSLSGTQLIKHTLHKYIDKKYTLDTKLTVIYKELDREFGFTESGLIRRIHYAISKSNKDISKKIGFKKEIINILSEVDKRLQV